MSSISAYSKFVRDTNATPDSRWTNGKIAEIEIERQKKPLFKE